MEANTNVLHCRIIMIVSKEILYQVVDGRTQSAIRKTIVIIDRPTEHLLLWELRSATVQNVRQIAKRRGVHLYVYGVDASVPEEEKNVSGVRASKGCLSVRF
jgi:hypothetical protein